MKRYFYIALLALLAVDFGQAHAADVAQESALKLEAVAKSMKRDFRGAESAYTSLLSINANNIEARVQRAIIRRELKNLQGMETDADQARRQIDDQLQQNPKDAADLYYHRSQADRLLKDFDAAERDLNQAINLGKRGNFDTDWKAIALERKMAQ